MTKCRDTINGSTVLDYGKTQFVNSIKTFSKWPIKQLLRLKLSKLAKNTDDLLANLVNAFILLFKVYSFLQNINYLAANMQRSFFMIEIREKTWTPFILLQGLQRITIIQQLRDEHVIEKQNVIRLSVEIISTKDKT